MSKDNIFNLINENTKYILILALFVGVLVYGQKFDLNPLDVQTKNFTEQIASLSQNQKIIDTDNSEVSYDNIMSTVPGEFYHLTFYLMLKQDAIQRKVPTNKKIEIYAVSSYNDKKKIGEILPVDESNHLYNIDFRTDGRYNDIVFKKENENSGFTAFIKKPLVTKINLDKTASLANLSPTILGDTKLISTGVENTPKNPAEIFKFVSKNSYAGQIFKAGNDQLAGVEFAINPIGSGGLGKYNIGIREAKLNNGVFEVGDKDFANYYFDSGDIDNFKIEKNIYKFPFAANLKKGKYYFIGITNRDVKFNLINTIALLGSSGDGGYMDGSMAAVNKDNKITKIDKDLYFKIYGLDYSKFGNDKVLTNSIIQDNGNGKGSFVWKTEGENTDFLDIDQINLPNKGKDTVFYDSIAKGVSASVGKGVNFIYKVNTIYPFSRMRIEMSEQETFNTLAVYYSFDKKHWKLIPRDYSGDTYHKITKDIKGNGIDKVIYLKITRDDENELNKLKKIQLIGLKEINVYAELVMK